MAATRQHRWGASLLSSLLTGALALPLGAARADAGSGMELRAGPLRADVMWGSASPYAGVFLWPDNGSPSQEFDLLDSGGGYFRVRARHSGQCLMLDERTGPFENGTRVIQHPYCEPGYAPAEWSVRTLSGTVCAAGLCTTGVDRHLLVNRATGRCLDADHPGGGPPLVQSVLQQWDCAASAYAYNIDNQAWIILPPGSARID